MGQEAEQKDISEGDNVSAKETSVRLDPSMIIIGLVTFVGDSARGILFPALWPLCQALGGNKVDLGTHYF